MSDFHESYQNNVSPESLEVSSNAARRKEVDCFNGQNGTENSRISSDVDISHALRRLEVQLSLEDDSVQDYAPLDYQDRNEVEDEYGVLDGKYHSRYAGVSSNLIGPSLLQDSGLFSFLMFLCPPPLPPPFNSLFLLVFLIIWDLEVFIKLWL